MFKILFGIIFYFLSANLSLANIDNEHWIFHHLGKDYSFKAVPSQKGLPKVHLTEIAKTFNLKIEFNWDSFQIKLINPSQSKSVSFYTFSNQIEGFNFTTKLSKSPEFNKVDLLVPIDFGDRALRPLLTGKAPPYIAELPKRTFDVVIDPGHGGNDWGTSLKTQNGVLTEKQITLEFARILKSQLEANGISAHLTRDDDVFLTLTERSEIANQLKAKLFISIHINSSPNPSHRGFELFVLSLKDQDSETRKAIEKEQQRIPDNLPDGFEKALADLRAEAQLEKTLKWASLISNTLKTTSSSAGSPIKMGPFFILYGAEMPSVLIELGFLTHAEDRKQILDHTKRNLIANNLSKAISDALKKEQQKP